MSGFTVGVIYEQVECRVQCRVESRVECRVECRAYFTVVDFLFKIYFLRCFKC
jgi:hypothetical protein